MIFVFYWLYLEGKGNCCFVFNIGEYVKVVDILFLMLVENINIRMGGLNYFKFLLVFFINRIFDFIFFII